MRSLAMPYGISLMFSIGPLVTTGLCGGASAEPSTICQFSTRRAPTCSVVQSASRAKGFGSFCSFTMLAPAARLSLEHLHRCHEVIGIDRERVVPRRRGMHLPVGRRRLRRFLHAGGEPAPVFADLERIDERSAFNHGRIVEPARAAHEHVELHAHDVAGLPGAFDAMEGIRLRAGITLDTSA